MKDKKQNQKNLIHPILITINLVLLLVMGSALGIGRIGLAQEGGDTPAPAPQKVEGNKNQVNEFSAAICISEIQKYAEPEFENYKQFMEENFKNKAATNDLLDIGLKRYDKFKADIIAYLELQFSQHIATAAQSQATAAAQLPGLAQCQGEAQKYIEDAAKMLQLRAETTSTIKRTSLFVEKYKQINGKLRSLDLDIMKMISNIATFEQKLPCYLKSCV